MPYLQLDVPKRYSDDRKIKIAQRLGETYARIMQTIPEFVTVAIRELNDHCVLRCGPNPSPASVLSCDIRRGRPPEQRLQLAQQLSHDCVEILGLDPAFLSVEFTQHDGSEIYWTTKIDGVVSGGLAPDWSPNEAKGNGPRLENQSADV